MDEALTSARDGGGRWLKADNIKAVLIFNVAAFHILIKLEPAQTEGVLDWITFFQFSVMPLFCFLAGYFSKNTAKAGRNAVIDYLLPYLLFNWLYVRLMEGVPIYSVAIPEYLYWYLLSMFFWRLISPVLARTRFVVPVSVALAVAVGFAGEIDSYLSMSRTLCYLPYFAAGLMVSERSLRRIERLPRWLVSLVAALVLAALCILRRRGVYDLNSMFYLAPYWWYYNGDIWRGALVRLLSYPLAGVFIVLYINGMPDRTLPWLTRQGRHTFIPYVGHAFIVTALCDRLIKMPELLKWYIIVPWAAVVAAASVFVLGLPCWDAALRAVQRFLKRIFVRSEEPV